MPPNPPPDSLFRDDARANILARLDDLRPGMTPLWGRMTAHQMVCHLADAFDMALGGRPVRDRSRPVVRTLARWYALHTPARMPKRVPTLRELDQDRGGTPPAEFAADVERVREKVARFVALGDALAGRTHAFFGPLSAREWGVWAYRHTDHHLRQFGLHARRGAVAAPGVRPATAEARRR